MALRYRQDRRPHAIQDILNCMESQLRTGVPLMILQMMKERGWSQTELGRRAGLTQGVISRVTSPRYMSNMKTLARIAKAFGCELEVTFVEKRVYPVPRFGSIEEIVALKGYDLEPERKPEAEKSNLEPEKGNPAA